MTTAAGQALGDTHDARAATTPRVRRRAARHHWIVRVTHWVNVVALGLMVTTGLRIFNAYPAFARRGESFCCYPFSGKPIPSSLTFGGWLAGARNWHFAAMWLLFLNGLVYVGFIYLHGEWRDLVPRRGDIRDSWEMIKFYVFAKFLCFFTVERGHFRALEYINALRTNCGQQIFEVVGTLHILRDEIIDLIVG